MLFKQKQLQGIKAGTISLCFRRWKAARVKKGSLIHTSLEQVEILDVVQTELSAITAKDAGEAAETLETLTRLLNSRAQGNIYRISVRYHGADPRIRLREKTDLTDNEIEAIQKKLQKMDDYSKEGPWTLKVLDAIKNYPKLRAADLADKISKDKSWLKPNIRKLKNLGLTISHEVGYSISPLGKFVLKKLT
ncbi:MAG: hypothetical protein HKN76_07915 [Saprospiraceae bacterium]|nr:hypothetical protein [Saprospiraceae bacterium]